MATERMCPMCGRIVREGMGKRGQNFAAHVAACEAKRTVTCDGCGTTGVASDPGKMPAKWKLVVGPNNDRLGYCPKCATPVES